MKQILSLILCGMMLSFCASADIPQEMDLNTLFSQIQNTQP